MGLIDSKSNNQFTEILKNYKVVKRVPELNISYLESINPDGKDAVSREFTNLDKNQHQKKIAQIEQHKKIWDNTHLVRIIEYLTSTQDQYCSTSFKIYALFGYPHRTLNQEIIQRSTQRQKFQQKELWSIIASCILGMSHLQKNNVRHLCLSSDSILVDGSGVIKISDPFCTSELPNYDKLLRRKTNQHVYLSPQLCETLQRAQVSISADINPYKSDVFTFGMLIMQAALLKYQDDCYREENTKINWDTIKYNLEQIGQIYSVDMKEMIKKLVSDVKERPDWLQLKQFMKDDGQDRRQQVKQDKVHYQEIPQMAQKTVNVTNLASRPQSHLGFVPHNVVHQPVSYIQNRPLPQAVQLNQIMHTQAVEIMPVQPSNVNLVKPSLGTRPADSYITKTKIDQNLIEVSDDEDDIQTNEGDPLHDHSNRQYQPLSYQPPIGVQNLPPPGGNYINPKLNVVSPIQQSTDSRFKYVGSVPVSPTVGVVPTRDLSNASTIIPGHRYVNNIMPQNLTQGGLPHHSITSTVNRSAVSSFQGAGFTGPSIPTTVKSSDNSNLFTDFSKLGINRSNYDITSNSNATPSHTFAQSNYTKVDDSRQGSRPISVHKDSRNILPQSAPTAFEVQRVVETFSQGSRYQGEKVNGMRHGKGKFYYQDGGLYDGEWKQNKMCGKGKLFYQSGKIAYEGDWDNDQFTGHGILYNQYPQALNSPYNCDDFDNMEEVWTKFEGNFVDDMKQGFGKLFFSNGEYYEGNFDGDVVNGKGIFHTMHGESINGLWKQNHLVKKLN